MKCKLCKGELLEWCAPEEVGYHGETEQFKSIWQCRNCDVLYEITFEATNIRIFKERNNDPK